MDKYKITCCSTADMSREWMETNQIPFAMFHYQLNGRVYSDDLYSSISPEKFYKLIINGSQPVTSQVNTEEYCALFEPLLEQGMDVLHLTLSSGISGTINSANIAKMQLEEKYPERKIVAAAVTMLWNVSIEGWLGVVIAVAILKTGIEVLMDSLNGIIRARIDSELSVNLKDYICKYPNVLGAYDLILHRYGSERIIGSVHVELPDEMTTREIHRLTRSITEDIYHNYNIILTIGIYASNLIFRHMNIFRLS